MRPTAAQLLGAARQSLRDVVLPAVDDRWARYVAGDIDRILNHLELRAERETALLQEDVADMAALLARLGTDSTVPVGDLETQDEQLRARLVAAIRELDDLPEQDSIADLRHDIRLFCRRQVDRHVALTRPTFMSFRPEPA